jgi:hypothetical protein
MNIFRFTNTFVNRTINAFSYFRSDTNYLVATEKPVGLILNFGERKVEVKRKIKELLQEEPLAKV